MAWRFVRQPNGLLARFSEVCDDFTHYDFTPAEAMLYCQDKHHMPPGDAVAKVMRAVEDREPWNDSKVGDGLSRWRDCLDTIRTVHGEATARERETELSKSAAPPTCPVPPRGEPD